MPCRIYGVEKWILKSTEEQHLRMFQKIIRKIYEAVYKNGFLRIRSNMEVIFE